MFITTANTLNIPPPLMDRMEIIRIAGYTEDEKVEIARKRLIPHAITKHGLDAKEWAIDDEALLLLIRRYTREAGVRNLERELSTLIRIGQLLLADAESIIRRMRTRLPTCLSTGFGALMADIGCHHPRRSCSVVTRQPLGDEAGGQRQLSGVRTQEIECSILWQSPR